MYNSRTKRIIQTIFIFIFIVKLSYAERTIEESKEYEKYMTVENEERLILKVKEAKEQIMAIDFIFTNPSKYETITFNRYDVVETEDVRRLSTIYTENQTDLVIEDKVINGKKVVYLKLDDETQAIAFTIYKDKTKTTTNADFIYLRFRVAEEKPDICYLKDNRIQTQVLKDIVNVTFSGISLFEGIENDDDFSVQYIVRFFDKEGIDTLTESPNTYFLLHSVNPLGSISFDLGGKSAAKDINVRVKGSLNNKKPQYALVFAIATYKNEKEYILYDPTEFKITLLGEEDNKGDDKKNDDGKTETEDNKTKNRTTFFIILGFSIVIVILVLIIIILYFVLKPKKDATEDSGEYKNVGASSNVNEEET